MLVKAIIHSERKGDVMEKYVVVYIDNGWDSTGWHLMCRGALLSFVFGSKRAAEKACARAYAEGR